jgi:hypothetical protein
MLTLLAVLARSLNICIIIDTVCMPICSVQFLVNVTVLVLIIFGILVTVSIKAINFDLQKS